MKLQLVHLPFASGLQALCIGRKREPVTCHANSSWVEQFREKFYYRFCRHPKNPRYLKDLCGKIINKWSRPIFNLQGDFASMTKEERIHRDKHMADRVLAANRVAKRKAEEAELKKELKPGDPGWIGRARVPMVDNREYVQRPEWTSHTDMSRIPKKEISLLEKHKRKFADKRKILKAQHAVQISIEGKAMNGV